MKAEKLLFICGAVLIMSISVRQTVYAGSINENEQSVISAINGQFEKDGVVYEVNPKYISSVTSYMGRDDVDLTSEEAQSAISEIYSNVQTGIESGYLTEVGRSDSGQAESPVSEENETPLDEKASDKGKEKHLEAETPLNENNSAENETDSKREQSPEIQTSPEKKQSTKNADQFHIISILELAGKAPPQTYNYLYEDTDRVMREVKISWGILNTITGILGCIIFLILILSMYMKLLVSHRHRKLRQTLKYILSFSMAVLSCIFCLCGGIWFGAFQKNAILNRLSDTGYYPTIYNELRKDTSISFALLNIPDSVMDEAITYEKVVLAARQQVENDLQGGTYKADTSLLVEPLKSDIEEYFKENSVELTNEAEMGINILMERLNEKYTALLKWPFAPWWLQTKGVYGKMAFLVFPLSLFLMAAAQLILIFIHHYKHRGGILGARGLLAGSTAGFLIFTVSFLILKERWQEISPSYMNSFFEIYINGIWQAGAEFCGIVFLFSGVILAAARAWKEGR